MYFLFKSPKALKKNTTSDFEGQLNELLNWKEDYSSVKIVRNMKINVVKPAEYEDIRPVQGRLETSFTSGSIMWPVSV